MSVGCKRNRKKFENVSIKINNVLIERVNHCKYLGVTIDTEFTWKPQVNNVKSKVLRNFYALRRARPFIDQTTALTLYNTII